MWMYYFTFEDAGSQPALALSNPHSATHMTGLDVAAGSASPTCAGGFTAAMGDDHEPEVLEHQPPDGMLVLHGRIFRDPARLLLRFQVAKLIQQFCGKSTSSQGFLLVLFFFYCFIKIAEETPFFIV